LAVKRLEKGVFLVSADRTKTNVMAMAWGMIGFQWSKPVFIAPVRTTRFTHGLIETAGEFVVCVQPPSMDDLMMQAGSSSGRDRDKIGDLGLQLFTIPEVSVPGIEGSLITYACRVLHTASAEPLSNHTFFFGEILSTYADESLG
jgi:flavin reductase (DIM6/NTAB) family NADH-FMN oxidoreductase RutF